MYKTILVPLDGSKQAEAILSHVEFLARQFDAKVIFFGVVEPDPINIAPEPIFSKLVSPQKRVVRRMDVEEYLRTQQENFREKGIDAQARIGDGPIVEEIMKVAEEVDLIAIASRGRTGIAGALFGNVTTGILNHTNRPLLLIRPLDK